MTHLNRTQIIQQLKNHGIDNTSSLSQDELHKLYESAVTAFISNMISFNTNNSIITLDTSKISIALHEVSSIDELYMVFEKLLLSYYYSEIKECLLVELKPSLVDYALTVLDIKNNQLQEIIIEEIMQKISFMPQEERYSYMEFLNNNRVNVRLLKNILHNLNDSAFRTSLGMIVNMKKYILSNYMHNDLEKNYKPYYNRSKEKQELIDVLKTIDSAYSKSEIDAMSIDELRDLIDSFREQERYNQKDKDDFIKYSQSLQQALYSDNDDLFNAIVVQVLEDVSKECLDKIKLFLSTKDPLFNAKFALAQNEWNNSTMLSLSR